MAVVCSEITRASTAYSGNLSPMVTDRTRRDAVLTRAMGAFFALGSLCFVAGPLDDPRRELSFLTESASVPSESSCACRSRRPAWLNGARGKLTHLPVVSANMAHDMSWIRDHVVSCGPA